MTSSAPSQFTSPYPRRAVRDAMIVTHIVFALNGLLFASWAARLPYVADQLDINDAQLGQVLLTGAIGALIGLPLAGRVAQRLGTRFTLLACYGVAIVGWSIVAVALLQHSLVFTMLGVCIYGVANGVWDVAQNVEGAEVERHWGKTIMPMFHASFSGGAFLGALFGSLMAQLGIGLPAQIVMCLAAGLIIVLTSTSKFLPAGNEGHAAQPADAASDPQNAARGRSAWTEARTLVIGLVVLGAALTEGSGNDWIAKAVVDELHGSESQGALVFAVFIGAMTIFRVLGSGLLDRYGRLPVLRFSFAASLVGLLAFVFAPTIWIALPGAVLWGAGAALGFPVGMSAAADDPKRAAARVSVVSTIGYTAFLLGPALLGYLSHSIGVRWALLAVGVCIVASLFAVRAAAPLKADEMQG
ncbi:MFS transporter [Micrococcales bacterium 31B]|nr:MFS transporter [Micrococcales bacterium 31B]